MSENKEVAGRRPISARDTRWAAACARWLANRGATPNGISVASAVFGAGAGLAFFGTSRVDGAAAAALLVAAAAGIQLRLLCNLFDGMVAVEGGRRTKSGEIFNDLPDRFADWAILLGAGYASGAGPSGPALGWAASLLAIFTAYVRALGSSAGARAHFEGPMAKQHRMAVMTAAALGSAVLTLFNRPFPLVQAALWVVVVGSAVTLVRRTTRIVKELESR